MLTPGDYGLYGKVLAITTLLLILRDMGLGIATIQSPDISQQQVSNLFWASTFIAFVMSVAVIIAAPLLAAFYNDPRVTGMARVIAISLFLGGMQLQHRALLERRMQFNATATIELSSAAIGVATAIVVASLNGGYWALAAMHVSTQLSSLIGNAAIGRWRPSLPRDWSGTRSLLRFGGSLAGFKFLHHSARDVAPNILIGKYLGDFALGSYTRAVQLLTLPVTMIILPIGPVAVSMLSRVIDDPVRVRRAHLQMVDRVTFLSIPTVAVLIAASDWIVAIMLGNQWRGTADVFAILALATLPMILGDTSDWLFMAYGKANALFNYGLLRIVFVVAGAVIGLSGGLIGAAWGIALSRLLLVLPLQFFVTDRHTPVSSLDMVKTILPSTLLGVVIVAAARTMRLLIPEMQNAFVGLAATAGLSLAIIATAVLLFPPLQRSMAGLGELFRLRRTA
jgi:PST family polysaccharide transporter